MSWNEEVMKAISLQNVKNIKAKQKSYLKVTSKNIQR
jgi:DNA mismatch repair protein MutH